MISPFLVSSVLQKHLDMALRRDQSYSNLSRREIAAMLVHCAYFRDIQSSRIRGIVMKLSEVFAYQDDRSEHYGRDYWEPMKSQHIPKESKLKELRLAFYHRRDNHPLTATGPAPRLVIALRGTLLYKTKDLIDDLRISGEVLLESDRVQGCLTLIEKVITEFLSKGGSKDEICLAGHSLGAGIALLVGKHLAAMPSGIDIDTHLFAPPMLTEASIAKDLLIKIRSPDQRHPHEATDEWHSVFTQLTDRLRESFGFGKSEKHEGVGIVGNAIVETFGKMDLDEEWKNFQKLRDWVPHFYLNQGDVICNEYIQYYKEQVSATEADIGISEQAIITRLFGGDAKYIKNVVPSANLNISKAFKGNKLLAHSLKQWHQYTDAAMELHQYQARLLDKYTRHTAQRAVHYTGHKLHGRSVVVKTVRSGAS